jgi:hypothetical protein
MAKQKQRIGRRSQTFFPGVSITPGKLIDKPNRSSEDELEMVSAVASLWHWKQRIDATPQICR